MINSIASAYSNGFSGFVNSAGKKARSGAFANMVQSASKESMDGVTFSSQNEACLPAITEKGKKSTGSNTLSGVQKQYFRDKYSGSDASGMDSLLSELTNSGVLSYQDYLLAGARPTTAQGTVTVTKGSADASDSLLSSGNYAEYFKKVIHQEVEEAEYIKKSGGEPSASFNECIQSHQHIVNVLESFL